MNIDLLAILSSVWQVLVVGLLFGAGLPALFALGVRSLAVTTVAADGVARTTVAGRVGAYAAFGLCFVAALLGVIVIVLGKQLFGH